MGSLGGSKSKSESKPLTPAQLQGYYSTLNANSGGRLADFARTGTQPTAYTPVGDAGRVTAPSVTAAPLDYQPSNIAGQLQAPASVAPLGYQPSDIAGQLQAPASVAPLGYQPSDIAGQLQAPTLGPAERVSYNALTPEQVSAAGGLGALREQVARRQNQQTLAQFAADPNLTTFQRLRANQLVNQDFAGTLDALAAEREAAITGLLSDQAQRTLQADLANQDAANQFGLAGAQMGMDFQRLLAGTLGDQEARTLQAALADQQAGQFNAQLGADYQRLLAGTLGDQEARALQAALADQTAINQAGQFNAQQDATAQQFNAQTAMTEAQRQYAAQLANAGLTREDMEALARIYFGGAGSTSSTKQSTPLFGGNDLINAATLGGLATGIISI